MRKKIPAVCLGVAGLFALVLAGCSSADAVAQFCASAMTTLAAARPVFDDMKQSCLREVNSRTDFGTFTLPSQDNAGCNAIGKQADGAVAAAKVLADYFSAIQSLASFGTEKAGTDAASLASQTGTALGAGSGASTALDSITKFLVSAATSEYRRKALEKDLPRVSANISAVAGALATIVREDYAGRLLKSEEQKTAVRYRDFAKGKGPEVVMMMDGRWQADEQALEARRASARSLVSALDALAAGFTQLAAKSHRLTDEDAAGLLAPYAAQIRSLIPAIQKAF